MIKIAMPVVPFKLAQVHNPRCKVPCRWPASTFASYRGNCQPGDGYDEGQQLLHPQLNPLLAGLCWAYSGLVLQALGLKKAEEALQSHSPATYTHAFVLY